MNFDWQAYAVCRKDPTSDYFAHEEQSRPKVPETAVQACQRCTVQPECLAHALKYENYGYWAGTTAAERRDLRKAYGVRLRRLEKSQLKTDGRTQ